MVWKEPALQRKALSYSGSLSLKADRMIGELQSWTMVISEHLRYFKRQHTWGRKWQPISVFVAWKIPRMELPGGPMGSTESQRVGHDWATSTSCMRVKSLQLSLTLCDPVDLDPTRHLCPWDSPSKNTGVGCHALLQRIFPTQGWNQVSYVSCIGRWVLYHWVTWESHKGQQNHGKPCQTLVACKIHLTPLVGDTGSPVGSIYVSAFL